MEIDTVTYFSNCIIIGKQADFTIKKFINRLSERKRQLRENLEKYLIRKKKREQQQKENKKTHEQQQKENKKKHKQQQKENKKNAKNIEIPKIEHQQQQNENKKNSKKSKFQKTFNLREREQIIHLNRFQLSPITIWSFIDKALNSRKNKNKNINI